MHCKYCGVRVDDNVLVCPLCHEKLDGYDEEKPSLYPEKQVLLVKKKHTHMTFNNLYLGISLAVFLTSLAVNFTLTPNVQWCWLTILIAMYGYLLVKNTILANTSIAVKVLLQCIMIVALLFGFSAVFEKWDPMAHPLYFISEYAFPLTIGIGNLVMVIFTCIRAKKHPAILVDCLFLLLLGLIPIILYAFYLLEILWPSLIVAVFSGVSMLLCVALGHKDIKEEFQKKFHM